MDRTVEFFKSLTKSSNRGVLVYLVISLFIIFVPVAIIVESSLQYKGLPTIVLILLDVLTTLLLFFIGVILSLSSAGEWVLRKQLRAKKLMRKDHKNRLLPLFSEVYLRSKQKYNNLSENIELFITDESYPNAFAAGKNTICVTKGLLDLSDDHIKGIIAHEFAHIAHKDTELTMVLLVGNIYINIYLIVTSVIINFIFSFVTSDENKSQGKVNIFAVIINIIFVWSIKKFLELCYLLVLKSARENEYNADKFSAELGYGSALAGALDLIAQEPTSKGFIEKLNSTHPDTDSRISRIEEVILPV